jgi:anti-sigma factor RsiW
MNISMNHTHPANDPPCSAPKIAADLKAYLDNELSVLRRRTVTTHLRQCAACRTEIAAMTNIANEIKSSGPDSAATLNPDMRQRLLDRLTIQQPASSPLPIARTLPLWRQKPLLVFGGGAASLAAFSVVFLPSLTKIRLQEQQKTIALNKAAQAVIQYSQEYGETFPKVETASEVSATPEAVAQAQESDAIGVASLSESYYGSSSGPVMYSSSQEYSKLPIAGAGFLRPRASSAEAKTTIASSLVERQVHREGSLTVAVAKLEESSDKVEQMVKASGGFVASNSLSTDGGGYKSANLIVRVPVEQFDDMLKQFAALGNVTAKSLSGEDITERMSDVTQAEQVLKDSAETAAQKLRMNRGSEKETRYREADLRRVKIELAQTQARLGLLRKMAKLSTINVSLTEKAKPAPQTSQGGFLGDMSETNRMASAAFASAVRVPVVLIIWVLAFSPLWVPMALFYRVASRRNRSVNAEV